MGDNCKPTVQSIIIEITPDKTSEPTVIHATPFVPNLYPQKPEKKLLSNGKRSIKLTIKEYLLISRKYMPKIKYFRLNVC
jgi:hypothetical protein